MTLHEHSLTLQPLFTLSALPQLFAFCLFFCLVLQGQQRKDTSYLHYLKKETAQALEHGNDSVFKELNLEFSQLARAHNDTMCMVHSFFQNAVFLPYPDNMTYADSIISLTSNYYKYDFPSYGYLLKGQLFEDNDELIKALAQYKVALNLATQKKDSIGIMDALGGIGSIKLTLGRYKEAQEHFGLSKKYVLNKPSSKDALRVNYDMARTFLLSQELDSAQFYINLGLNNLSLEKKLNKTSKAFSKYSAYYPSFVGMDAMVKYYQKENFVAVRDTLTKFLPAYENDPIYLGWAHYILGKIALDQQQNSEALNHFISIDSLFTPEDWRFSRLKAAYAELIKLHKKDSESQLDYIKKYITYDSIRNAKMRYLANEVTSNYDLPKVAELKKRIAQTNNRIVKKSKNQFLTVFGIALGAIGICFVFYHRYRKTKKRLTHLMQEESVPKTIPAVQKPKKSQAIDAEHLTHILTKLDAFEASDLFLDPAYNMQNLCEFVGRNANWTSKVISDYKNPEGFRAYLKDLRISYAITDLKKNTPKMTIAGMASSYGFGSANTFSKSFKERTQVPLSSFLAALPQKANH